MFNRNAYIAVFTEKAHNETMIEGEFKGFDEGPVERVESEEERRKRKAKEEKRGREYGGPRLEKRFGWRRFEAGPDGKTEEALLKLSRPDNGEERENIRTFRIFRDDEGEVVPVRVSHVGKFDELAEQVGMDEKSMSGLRGLLGVFDDARVEKETPSGETIEKGPHCLVAGGFVRDLCLGKQPHDVDLATDLTYDQIKELLDEHYGEALASGEVKIAETGKAFGVLRVVFLDTGEEYEISTFRDERPLNSGGDEQRFLPGIDAQRRDFTINGMFYNPKSGNIVDYAGGFEDIRDRTLRFVGDARKRIDEDPLRMLRYARFMQKTGFEADDASLEAIAAESARVKELSSERIREEATKIFEQGNVGDGLRILEDLGLLKEVLPEVADLRDAPQGPPYHLEGDVLEHTQMVAGGLPEDASTELIWATIFHDIAKPETRAETILEDGSTKVSFIGHEKMGAEKIQPILDRYRFSNEEKKRITWLVENHLKIFDFGGGKMSDKTAKNLIKEQWTKEEQEKGEGCRAFEELIDLAYADGIGRTSAQGVHGRDMDTLHPQMTKRYYNLMEKIKEEKEKEEEVEKCVDGRDIIVLYQEIYHRNPKGPDIGTIKRNVLNILAEANIADADAVREKMREVIANFHFSGSEEK